MIWIQKIYVFELWIKTNEHSPHSFKPYLSSRDKALKKLGMNWNLNPDLCDVSSVFYQLSF